MTRAAAELCAWCQAVLVVKFPNLNTGSSLQSDEDNVMLFSGRVRDGTYANLNCAGIQSLEYRQVLLKTAVFCLREKLIHRRAAALRCNT